MFICYYIYCCNIIYYYLQLRKFQFSVLMCLRSQKKNLFAKGKRTCLWLGSGVSLTLVDWRILWRTCTPLASPPAPSHLSSMWCVGRVFTLLLYRVRDPLVCVCVCVCLCVCVCSLSCCIAFVTHLHRGSQSPSVFTFLYINIEYISIYIYYNISYIYIYVYIIYIGFIYIICM